MSKIAIDTSENYEKTLKSYEEEILKLSSVLELLTEKFVKESKNEYSEGSQGYSEKTKLLVENLRKQIENLKKFNDELHKKEERSSKVLNSQGKKIIKLEGENLGMKKRIFFLNRELQKTKRSLSNIEKANEENVNDLMSTKELLMRRELELTSFCEELQTKIVPGMEKTIQKRLSEMKNENLGNLEKKIENFDKKILRIRTGFERGKEREKESVIKYEQKIIALRKNIRNLENTMVDEKERIEQEKNELLRNKNVDLENLFLQNERNEEMLKNDLEKKRQLIFSLEKRMKKQQERTNEESQKKQKEILTLREKTEELEKSVRDEEERKKNETERNVKKIAILQTKNDALENRIRLHDEGEKITEKKNRKILLLESKNEELKKRLREKETNEKNNLEKKNQKIMTLNAKAEKLRNLLRDSENRNKIEREKKIQELNEIQTHLRRRDEENDKLRKILSDPPVVSRRQKSVGTVVARDEKPVSVSPLKKKIRKQEQEIERNSKILSEKEKKISDLLKEIRFSSEKNKKDVNLKREKFQKLYENQKKNYEKIAQDYLAENNGLKSRLTDLTERMRERENELKNVSKREEEGKRREEKYDEAVKQLSERVRESEDAREEMVKRGMTREGEYVKKIQMLEGEISRLRFGGRKTEKMKQEKDKIVKFYTSLRDNYHNLLSEQKIHIKDLEKKIYGMYGNVKSMARGKDGKVVVTGRKKRGRGREQSEIDRKIKQLEVDIKKIEKEDRALREIKNRKERKRVRIKLL